MAYLFLTGIVFIFVAAIVIFLLVVQMLFLRKHDPYSPEAIEARKKAQKSSTAATKKGTLPHSTIATDPLRGPAPPGKPDAPRLGLVADSQPQETFPASYPTTPPYPHRPQSTMDTHAPAMLPPLGEPLYTANGPRRFSGNPASLAGITPLSARRPGLKAEDLLHEYTEGMRIHFDEHLGMLVFITLNVVMNTPAEVALAFQVCSTQMRGVLRSRGLQKAALLTDIAGLNIGREATTAWGQAFKNCLDDICIKVGQDIYLVAHYNSTITQPSQEQMREKMRRIQIMTSATANNFQSNIFDTREEAVAFLARMRELYHIERFHS